MGRVLFCRRAPAVACCARAHAFSFCVFTQQGIRAASSNFLYLFRLPLLSFFSHRAAPRIFRITNGRDLSRRRSSRTHPALGLGIARVGRSLRMARANIQARAFLGDRARAPHSRVFVGGGVRAITFAFLRAARRTRFARTRASSAPRVSSGSSNVSRASACALARALSSHNAVHRVRSAGGARARINSAQRAHRARALKIIINRYLYLARARARVSRALSRGKRVRDRQAKEEQAFLQALLHLCLWPGLRHAGGTRSWQAAAVAGLQQAWQWWVQDIWHSQPLLSSVS